MGYEETDFFLGHVRFRKVAECTRIGEKEILHMAAKNELSLGVRARGWFAAPATREVDGSCTRTGDFVLLDEEFLYPKPSYFLDLVTSETVAGGFFRSTSNGKVDRWVKLKRGKPNFTREDLWVPMEDVYLLQDKQKQNEGRMTIEEAAEEIARGAGESQTALLRRLISDAKSGSLPTYNPGARLRRSPSAGITREFYEEVYPDDLNAWIEKNEPRIDFRFSISSPSERSSREQLSKQLSRKRKDILFAPITDAITLAGSRDTSTVWAKLRELALQECSPFTGETAGDGLSYTDSAGKVRKLTKNALHQRLKR